MKNILALSGSIRQASTSERILRFIDHRYHDQLAVERYDLSQLPYFNADIEAPPVVADFLHKITQADGVIVCTPEYVFSLPGVLKNALEWTVATTVFLEKPVALITAAASGQHAHESLALMMRTFGAAFDEQASLLIRGAKSKLTRQGDIVDEAILQGLDTLITSLQATLANRHVTTNS